MFTSNFRLLSGRLYESRGVSIAVGTPAWFKGQQCPQLNPPRDMLRHNLTQEEWTCQYYRRVLNRLDPQQVYDDLGPDAILLCWEPPGDFCHRRLVAEWLERHLGISVPEYDRATAAGQGSLF